jgi:hypothetical protein
VTPHLTSNTAATESGVNPSDGAAIKARVRALGDRSHHSIIEREKRFIDWKKIARAEQAKGLASVSPEPTT